VFTVPDQVSFRLLLCDPNLTDYSSSVWEQWAALKQQAQAVFIIEALKARNLTLWEAFSAFDYDNNGILAPSEFYGALRWLGVPNLTAEDVVDFIEAADTNNDGMVDYKEYMDMLSFAEEATEEEKTDTVGEAAENRVPIAKIEPYGAEVLREIMVQRKQQEQARIREERLRKQAYHDALDVKVFEEELEASRLRKGGANPAVTRLPEGPRTPKVNADSPAGLEGTAATGADVMSPTTVTAVETVKSEVCVTDFRFSTNQHPLRFVATGKSNFFPIHMGTAADAPIKPMRCAKNHVLGEYNYYWMDCEKCHTRGTKHVCWPCYKFFCSGCYDGDRRSKELDRRDCNKHPTFLRCQNACSFTLQVPLAGGADPVTGNYTITLETRFEKLPVKGSMQSLLRFSLPDLNQARKMHRTSVYLNGDGIVVGRPLETGGGVEVKAEPVVEKTAEPQPEAVKPTEEGKEEGEKKTEAQSEEEKPPKKVKPVSSGIVKVRPGRWTVISVSVEPEKGCLSAYIDGKVTAPFRTFLLLYYCVLTVIPMFYLLVAVPRGHRPRPCGPAATPQGSGPGRGQAGAHARRGPAPSCGPRRRPARSRHCRRVPASGQRPPGHWRPREQDPGGVPRLHRAQEARRGDKEKQSGVRQRRRGGRG
jgi:hypothetical protein